MVLGITGLRLLLPLAFFLSKLEQVDSSLYFDGSSGYKYAVMDDYSLLEANSVGDMSFSSWVWFDNSIDYYGSMMSNRGCNTGVYCGFLYAFAKYSNSYSPYLQYRWNYIATSNTYNYIDGAWHHSVITVTGDTIKFYMDGLEYYTYTADNVATWDISENHALWIGLDDENKGSTQFAGYLMDLSIWNRGLTQDEIEYLCAVRIKDSPLIDDVGLLHYFPIDNASNYSDQYFEDMANGHDAYLGIKYIDTLMHFFMFLSFIFVFILFYLYLATGLLRAVLFFFYFYYFVVQSFCFFFFLAKKTGCFANTCGFWQNTS